MNSPDAIKISLSQAINKKESEINLGYAALLLSQYLSEPFDITPYLSTLDEMAELARPVVEQADTDQAKIKNFNEQFFDRFDFCGNLANYYSPDNSFLDKVLNSRKGIPISLSVLYLEIGRRLQLPVWGIGMPRHFIVGYGSPESPIYIDVFDKGHILSEDDCLTIAHVDPSNRQTFREAYLQPAAKTDILYRMLLNLKHIYLAQRGWALAYYTIDLMLVIRPRQINEIKDRGLLAYRLNWLQQAVFDLNRYLYLAPDSTDAEWLQERVNLMEEQILRLN